MSPKRQSTAQQRARQASRHQDAKYTAALREERTRATICGLGAPEPATELLVDPTFAHLRARALELADSLTTTRTIIETQHPPIPDVACRTIDNAKRMLDHLASQLEEPQDKQTLGVLDKWTSNTAATLRSAQQLTDGAAAFRLAADQLAAHRLRRAVRAIFLERCTEGVDSDEPCAPQPGRVIVRVQDAFGVSDSDQACALHAAEHVLRRAPGETEFRLHGDRETRAIALTVIRQLRAETFPSSEAGDHRRSSR